VGGARHLAILVLGFGLLARLGCVADRALGGARSPATIVCDGFPQTRLRRLRRTVALRDLVRETELSPERLIAPLFVAAAAEPIDSMPGQSR